MPAKFKKSHKEYKRGVSSTNQKMVHYYLKNTPKQELIDYINSSNAKPKIVQKCRNELTRRGVVLVLSLIHI